MWHEIHVDNIDCMLTKDRALSQLFTCINLVTLITNSVTVISLLLRLVYSEAGG